MQFEYKDNINNLISKVALPLLKTNWSTAKPPFVALPSRTIRKSDCELTVTCPGYQSGLAVLRVVADMCQTCDKIKERIHSQIKYTIFFLSTLAESE